MKRTLLLFTAFLVYTLSFAQVPSYVPTNGLVMYLPFNGNANDASGNGNNGVVNGCTLTTGQSGLPNTAYKFNGTSNFIRVANSNSLNPNTQMTLYAKVQVDGFYNGNCHGNDIIDKATTDYVPGLYSLRFAPSNSGGNCNFQDSLNDNYYFHYNNQYPSYAIVNNPPYVQKGNWDNLIATYDGNIAKMYVNGVLRFQFSTPGALIGTNTNDLFIGAKNDPGFEYWFNGKMDDVAIWNRALTECEVRRLSFGEYVAQQPTNKYALIGSNATFTVVSNIPAAAARYQWQVGSGTTFINLSNGGQYSGVTTSSLTVSNITALNQNQMYRCLVSDSSRCFTDSTTAVKLTTNVGVTTTSVAVGYLEQNMPNPSRGETVINYNIVSLSDNAAIEVYDYQGRKVAIQYLPKVKQGNVTISNLKTGVYFYVLIVDGHKADTKKMVVIE